MNYEEIDAHQLEFGLFECAILVLESKLKSFDHSYEKQYKHHPIDTIKHRIKSPESITKKLLTKGLPITYNAVVVHLNDVAGMRIICPFIDDIYQTKEFISNLKDISIINIKDYISHPKQNGYRSLHMIVEVPVKFSDYIQPIKVEIQIRTIAMDFWASLEHQLVYKSVFKNNVSMIHDELNEYAQMIFDVDQRMMNLKNQMEE